MNPYETLRSVIRFDRFETDRGVEFDDRQFGLAIGHLSLLGRLRTPRPDTWEQKGPRPTWLNPTPVHIG